MRRQKAVYWRKSGTNEFGEPVFDDPVEIACRWEHHEGQVRDEKGELVQSKAEVYVDREMELGDMLQEGELSTDTPDDPRGKDDIYEIQGFMKLPNVRATQTLFVAYL